MSKEKQTTEVIKNFNEKTLEDVISVINSSMPADWPWGDRKKYFREMLGDKRNINILLKKDNEIVGYLLAKPYEIAFEELKNDDPEMQIDINRYYIEFIAISPDYRGSYGYLDLANKMFEEAKKRGVNKFSTHIRKINGLSKSIQKLFSKDVTNARLVPSWRWCGGEPFDYVEVTLSRSLLELKITTLLYKVSKKIRKIIKKYS
jgi:ribosomal protein S18 acetylase RimI-like enzyme